MATGVKHGIELIGNNCVQSMRVGQLSLGGSICFKAICCLGLKIWFVTLGVKWRLAT